MPVEPLGLRGLQSPSDHRRRCSARYRESVAFEIPSVRQMSLTEFVGSLWSVLTCRFFLSSRFRGRPPFLPQARAAARPARVRSQMMDIP